MLILAIDTSAVASAALVSDDTPESLVGSFATEDTRSHAEVLAPGIEALLAEAGLSGADVDAVVTGVGPGPFTGLRSGIVTARTLAFVWGKPLYGLMSLDAIALEVAESTDAAPEFIVATDARRKEVYWARYALSSGQLPHLLDGPHVGFAADLPDLPVYGAGAGLYADVVKAVPDSAPPAGGPLAGPVRPRTARRGGTAARLHPAVPARVRRPGARPAEEGAVNAGADRSGQNAGQNAGQRRTGHGRGPAPLPGGVTLRDMTPADIPAVHELERRLFPVDAWPLQMFAAELAQAETRRYLVAERPGRIVGYAGLMCIQPIADVQTIAVVPEQEGRGIGSALLTELIRESRLRRAEDVLLEVRADNPRAQQLYRRYGFEQIHVRPRYYRDGVDALIMRLRLGTPDHRHHPPREADRP